MKPSCSNGLNDQYNRFKENTNCNVLEFVNCDYFAQPRRKFGDIFCTPSGQLCFHCDHCKEDFDADTIHKHMDLVFTETSKSDSTTKHIENKISNSDSDCDILSSQSFCRPSCPSPPTHLLKEINEDNHGLPTAMHRRPIKCNYCEAVFVCNGMKEQHKIIHGVKLKENFCSKCKSVWHTKAQLSKHLNNVHQPDRPVFTCVYCAISFASRHELIVHQMARPLTKSGEASEKRRQRIEHIKNYKCLACPEMFNSKRAQREHFIVHGDKPFKCIECPYECRRLPRLNEHMLQHSGHKPFLCDICGKAFPSKAYVKIHLRLHVGDRPYKCIECEKRGIEGISFAISWQLARHVLHKHSSEQPRHVCDICGKLFKFPFRLKEHKRIHNGEKPYRCLVCDKSFSRQNTCRLHMRLHSGEKPFRCRYCDNSFKHSSSRIKHERELHISKVADNVEDQSLRQRNNCPNRLTQTCSNLKKNYPQEWNQKKVKVRNRTHTQITFSYCVKNY